MEKGLNAMRRASLRRLPHAFKMKISLLLVLFITLASCARVKPDHSAEETTTIAKLPLPAVESGLEQVDIELEKVNAQVRTVENRRDSLRLKETDATRNDAVEGAEAELESLLSKRSLLLHRKHLLEGRMRELTGDQPEI